MKKKGLIISTVVMVVVLIASLTTATYAWFSSQASATVDDLAMTTKAADGLQIAMINGNKSVADIVSGNMVYNKETNKWEGDVNDWGSSLGFDAIDIGEITDAVTYWTSANYPTFSGYSQANTITAGTTYYKAESLSATAGQSTTKNEYDAYAGTKYSKVGNVYNPVVAFADNTEYFKLVSVKATTSDTTRTDLLSRNVNTTGGTTVNGGIYNTGEFLVPTGYDESIKPIGYQPATKNGNYYYLTMAIKPVTAVTKIGFSMQFTPTQGATTLTTLGEAGSPNGAMAAATRCNINVSTGTSATINKQIAPFSAFKFDGGTLSKAESKDFETTYASDGEYNDNGIYNFYIANSSVNAGTVYYITMEIWIEGTDGECVQDTAGGGFNLKIDFKYDKDDTTSNVDTSTFTALLPV